MKIVSAAFVLWMLPASLAFVPTRSFVAVHHRQQTISALSFEKQDAEPRHQEKQYELYEDNNALDSDPRDYWFDDRIHKLGNTGFLGAVHASIAPLSTKFIDDAAYGRIDVREKLAKELSKTVGKQKARVLDLCCGVGMSTRALQKAFPDADTILGLDTSSEMVAMAEFITKHVNKAKSFFDRTIFNKDRMLYNATHFVCENAEHTNLPDKSFDLVTVMYGFHETPLFGRDAILKEARRLLKKDGTLAVIDISVDYQPSEKMLGGEPYVKEYQQNIHKQLDEIDGFNGKRYETIVPNQLGMWVLKRATT